MKPADLRVTLSDSLGLGLGGGSCGGGAGGNGEGVSLPAERRKETLNIFDFDLGSFTTGSTDTFSFPLPDLWTIVPDSSRVGTLAALDLVAERTLCSSEDRRRRKVFASGMWEDVDLSFILEEEVDASFDMGNGLDMSRRTREGCRTAAVMYIHK